ncbi:hypothetical protein DLM75_20080 [Leptospira stimsonii]|uniref:Uncharacterized protein n=1 Tax=Leptospira stimsonii TaxID=2202203 RepID=A0A396YY20_9LEPT|nr:hypothetical protein DLM75_20080 [Leptospira stimsonii]
MFFTRIRNQNTKLMRPKSIGLHSFLFFRYDTASEEKRILKTKSVKEETRQIKDSISLPIL